MAALLLQLTLAATAAPPERSSYIVVLHDTETSPAAAAREIAGKTGGEVGYVYQHALKGFSITVPAQAAAGLRNNPRVKYVANDDIRYAFAQTTSTGVRRIFATGNANIDIDTIDDWRVDADVAVIDTGIDLQHPDLHVAGGVNCTGTVFNAKCVAGGDDDHYHGTHVAGIIGALDNNEGVVGVAPGARLWAVKVLDSNGSGYSSWIIAGIDWVTGNADKIEVANMSLGGPGYNQAEFDAIQGAVNKGIAFAVAAGNSDDDAKNYSPAAFGNVLTVSALADFNGLPGGGAKPTCRTDQDDTLADFSNWGSAIDVAAPGVCILSTYPLERGSFGTLSGTSMASPHVAGALALLASASNPNSAAAVYALYDQVVITGNLDWTDDSNDGRQEALLDVHNVVIFKPSLIAGEGGNPVPENNITLTVRAYKVKAIKKADLSWTGASTTYVDIFRDNTKLTTVNDGAYTDSLGKTVVSATYKVCDSGTTTCSNSVTVSW
jgi:subtilisin family serine protease